MVCGLLVASLTLPAGSLRSEVAARPGFFLMHDMTCFCSILDS